MMTPTQSTELWAIVDKWRQWAGASGRHCKARAQRVAMSIKNLHAYFDQHGVATIEQANKAMFDQYAAMRFAQGAKPRTVLTDFYTLHASFEYAVSRDIADRNPLRGYWKGYRFKEKVPDVPRPEIIQLVFDALPDTDTRRAFYFILSTGCRSGEAFALQASDVTQDAIIFRECKGGYSRVIPRPQLPFELDTSGSALTHGKSKVSWKVGDNNLIKKLHKACKQAGVPLFNVHTLRHAYATYMLALGKATVYDLMAWCGWKSFDIVQRYVTISPLYKCDSFMPKWQDCGTTAPESKPAAGPLTLPGQCGIMRP